MVRVKSEDKFSVKKSQTFSNDVQGEKVEKIGQICTSFALNKVGISQFFFLNQSLMMKMPVLYNLYYNFTNSMIVSNYEAWLDCSFTGGNSRYRCDDRHVFTINCMFLARQNCIIASGLVFTFDDKIRWARLNYLGLYRQKQPMVPTKVQNLTIEGALGWGFLNSSLLPNCI